MNYGERLQKSLLESGRDRKDVALACGCTVQNLGMVITSAAGKERSLSAVTHVKAARFLGVDAYWLATGIGKMHSDANVPNTELSREALELAMYFDKLLPKMARTRAYVAAMSAILRELDRTEHLSEG